MSGKRVLALFDVDGTLTVPRKVWDNSICWACAGLGEQLVDGVRLIVQTASQETLSFLQELRKVRLPNMTACYVMCNACVVLRASWRSPWS